MSPWMLDIGSDALTLHYYKIYLNIPINPQIWVEQVGISEARKRRWISHFSMHFLRAFCRNTSGSESIHPPHSTSSNCCILMRRFPRGQTWPKRLFWRFRNLAKKTLKYTIPPYQMEGWGEKPSNFCPFKNLGKDQICIGSAEPHEWLSAPKVWSKILGLGTSSDLPPKKSWNGKTDLEIIVGIMVFPGCPLKKPMYCVSVAITSFYSYQQTSTV